VLEELSSLQPAKMIGSITTADASDRDPSDFISHLYDFPFILSPLYQKVGFG
jgi:hypothetical protein